MLLDPLKRNVFSIPLRVRIRIFAKPLLKERFHRTAVRVPQLNMTQIIPMIKKQVADLDVSLQFFLSCALVILILVAPSIERGLNLVA